MAAQPKTKTYPLLSRREIEGLIADGRKVFILDQHVIKADAWMPYHPGGDKAIQHMVGRDATDEVTAYVDPCPSHSLSQLTFRRPASTLVRPSSR